MVAGTYVLARVVGHNTVSRGGSLVQLHTLPPPKAVEVAEPRLRKFCSTDMYRYTSFVCFAYGQDVSAGPGSSVSSRGSQRNAPPERHAQVIYQILVLPVASHVKASLIKLWYQLPVWFVT